MDIKQSFFTAIRSLLVNKIRFVQATLTMVVAVAGVVLTLCISSSLLNSNKLEDEAYSSSLLMVDVMTNVDLSKQIMPADVEQVAKDNPDVIKAVSPVVYFDLQDGVRYGDKAPESAFLEGVGAQYLDMMPIFTLQEGRFLQPMDISREQRVCVIGNQIANELMGGDALGKELKIWGENYTVVGVLDVIQSANQPEDETCEICIPYPNAKKMVGQRTTSYNYNSMYDDRYYVDANGEENMYNAILAVEDMMEERTGMKKGAAWQLWVTAIQSLSGSIKDAIFYGTSLAMVGAIIILLVAGVNIMNVMQGVVQERTKEIGIRKAFGASNEDIKKQFIFESAVISLLGGSIGIIIGLFGSYATCVLAVPISVARGVYYRPSLDYMDLPILPILAAVGFSVLIGVIFGTYPAQQAAKMEIVDAINSD